MSMWETVSYQVKAKIGDTVVYNNKHNNDRGTVIELNICGILDPQIQYLIEWSNKERKWQYEFQFDLID